VKAVADAGPLIAFGKLGLLNLLPQLYQPVLVPSAVYTEVVTQGLAAGRADAAAVEMAILRGDLAVVELSRWPRWGFPLPA
jgi:predicted nucleic acid-binding protein